MAFMLVIIGIFIFTQNPSLDPDLAFLEVFKNLSETVFSLAAIMLFAGLMSSADTNIYIVSSFFTRIKSNNNIIKRTRIASVIFVLFGIIFAIIFPSVTGITIFAAGFSLLISVGMIYLIAGGRKKEKFISSFFLATIFLAIGIYIFGLEPTIAIFPVLGGVLGLLIPSKILTIFLKSEKKRYKKLL
jgi:uncharacterized membrane protein YozB (DUF420 family)